MSAGWQPAETAEALESKARPKGPQSWEANGPQQSDNREGF